MKKRGFTLAEVLITLGIIGVIAALVIPQFAARVHYQANASKLATVVSDYENIFGMMLMKENAESIYETQFGGAYSSNNATEMERFLTRYTTVSRTGTRTFDLGYLAYSMTNPFVPAAMAEGTLNKSTQRFDERFVPTDQACKDPCNPNCGAAYNPNHPSCSGSGSGNGSGGGSGSGFGSANDTPQISCPSGFHISNTNTGNCSTAVNDLSAAQKVWCCPSGGNGGNGDSCGCNQNDDMCIKKCECVEQGKDFNPETGECVDSNGGNGNSCTDFCTKAMGNCYDEEGCKCQKSGGTWDPVTRKCNNNGNGGGNGNGCTSACAANDDLCIKRCECIANGGTWENNECKPGGGGNGGGGGGTGSGGSVMNTINNAPVSTSDFNFRFGFATPSGANLFLSSSPNNSNLATVYIDVNGGSAPNRFGRDVFAFVLNTDGHLLPYGSRAAAEALGLMNSNTAYLLPIDTEITATVDLQQSGTDYTWRGSNRIFGCTVRGRYDGLGCTGRLIENNYKVDY